MKKKIYFLCLLAMMLFACSSQAQYNIAWHSVKTIDMGDSLLDLGCYDAFLLKTNAYSPTLRVTTYFGNGTSNNHAVIDSGSFGYLKTADNNMYPGIFTIKQVLYNSTTAIDSVVFPYHHFPSLHSPCGSAPYVNYYYDSSGSCSPHPFDLPYPVTSKWKVDSAGIAIDTLEVQNGIYLVPNRGPVGTAYTLTNISVLPGVTITCPPSGILFDTVKAANDSSISPKEIGIQCTGSAFDLAVNGQTKCGRHYAQAVIFAANFSCNPEDAVVTVNFSPKYGCVYEAHPSPLSIAGTTVTWSLAGMSLETMPLMVSFDVNGCGLPHLTIGDTIHASYNITPTAGDADASNNYMVIVDTVRGGFDPNEMHVTPQGYIAAGTQLDYEIDFENTGNDTAFNIYVLDTLPTGVDPHTLKVTFASAQMSYYVVPQTDYNVVKFDFARINLLDSSHHGQCDGMIKFSVMSYAGLADGTTLFNKAGIYFDDNPVVMTNTVEDIIGIPANVPVDNSPKMAVYPNPATNELIVKADAMAFSAATVTNIIGQVMQTSIVQAAITKMDVSKLPPGLYYLELRGESGVKVAKFEKL